MLSGTLVSTMLLEGPLVPVVHARKMAVKKTTKVSRVSGSVRQAPAPPQQQRRLSSRGKSLRPAARALVSPARPFPRKHVVSASTMHLGTFTVRAYTHYHSPGVAPNKTATGTVPVTGRTVAVDPHVIPLGSKIHIDGVGERIAEDTGGKIKGKTLDLFLPSVKDCREFGVQTQEVRLLAR
jgi:3D (Asp-Asp-Asp) domain-containing protein